MIDKIQFKRSVTAGYVPPVGSVAEGEFLLNLADRQIFTADHSGSIISIGGSGGAGSGMPVGTIAAFVSKTLPNGFLFCDGSVFDQLTYPDLYKILGSNILPDLRDKYLKGLADIALSPLTTVPWMIPEHTHSTDISHGHGASSSFRGNALPAHNHQVSVGSGGSNGGSMNWYVGDNGGGTRTANTTGKSAGTPSGSVSTTVNNFTGSKISTGIREAFNKGSKLDVDHVTVVYAIKAAGYVTNEGLMAVEGMQAQIDDVQKQQAQFNGSMVGSEQQFPPLPAGQTPGDIWTAKDGSELLRTAYPALWAWAQMKGLVVTEAKWQELAASSHGGAVAVYSDGDGSTTFRVPSVGEFGMVQRPTGKGFAISEAHFIGYADSNKAHAHTRGTMDISGQLHGASASSHGGIFHFADGAFSVLTGLLPPSGYASSFQNFESGAQRIANVQFNASNTWTGETSSEGSNETAMKHMWCSIWIYSGNNWTSVPLPTPDYIKQIDVNKENISKLDTRVTALESSGGGGSGSGVPIYVKKSSDFTAEIGKGYNVDVVNGAVSVRMPMNPVVGSVVYVKDYKGDCGLSSPIVLQSLNKIQGSDEDWYITSGNASFVFSYVDEEQGWQVVDGIGEGSSGLPYEEVVILPPKVGGTSGNITLPSRYTWSDFERIEFSVGAAGSMRTYNAGIIPKEQIRSLPTSWHAEVRISDAASFIYALVSATSSTQAVIASGGNPIAWMKGYTKYKPVFNPPVLHQSNPNLLINGDFSVWQRGAGFSTGGYNSDRWHSHLSSPNTVSKGFNQTDGSYMNIDFQEDTTFSLGQRLELNGTLKYFEGKTFTASWKSFFNVPPSGPLTFSVVLGHVGGETGILSIPYNYSSSGKYSLTFTIPNLSGYVLNSDSFLEVRVFSDLSTDNISSQAIGVYWAKLEQGSYATTFVPDSPQENLAKCQRYFCKSFEVNTAPGHGPNTASFLTNIGLVQALTANIAQGGYVRFPVDMRKAPSITRYGNSQGFGKDIQPTTGAVRWNTNSVAIGIPSSTGFIFSQQVASNNILGVLFHYTADAEL